MNAQPASFPISIFYDASCQLCRREMHTLKRYDVNDRLRLLDCSATDFRDEFADKANIAVADMMRHIHAHDQAGQWFIGVDVFIVLYREVGIEMMARLWSWPYLRPIWDKTYCWIAANRMRLSKLGCNRLFEWLVGWAARRALRRKMVCAAVCMPHCQHSSGISSGLSDYP